MHCMAQAATVSSMLLELKLIAACTRQTCYFQPETLARNRRGVVLPAACLVQGTRCNANAVYATPGMQTSTARCQQPRNTEAYLQQRQAAARCANHCSHHVMQAHGSPAAHIFAPPKQLGPKHQLQAKPTCHNVLCVHSIKGSILPLLRTQDR
jgi:hypothetical protein